MGMDIPVGFALKQLIRPEFPCLLLSVCWQRRERERDAHISDIAQKNREENGKKKEEQFQFLPTVLRAPSFHLSGAATVPNFFVPSVWRETESRQRVRV
jgi:hypothetical protein